MRDLKAPAGRARAGPVSDFLVPATILAQHGPKTALPAQQQRGFGSLEQGEHIGVSHVSVGPDDVCAIRVKVYTLFQRVYPSKFHINWISIQFEQFYFNILE